MKDSEETSSKNKLNKKHHIFIKKPQPTAGAFGCGKKENEVLSNVGEINHIRKILKYDELKSLVQYDKGKR